MFLQTLGFLLLTPMSGSPDAQAVVKLLEARYHPAQTLRATFLERYLENGRLARVEAGVAFFRRPGKMRWEYESPEKNLFLVDGKTAWFYVPADHTVTRVPVKESTDWRTPLALLTREMKISRVCVRVTLTSLEKPANPENVLLSCELRAEQPKGHPSQGGSLAQESQTSTRLLLEVGPNTGTLDRVLVRDRGGVEVEFRFTNWQINPSLPESLFHFDAPRGVAVVNGDLSAQTPKN